MKFKTNNHKYNLSIPDFSSFFNSFIMKQPIFSFQGAAKGVVTGFDTSETYPTTQQPKNIVELMSLWKDFNFGVDGDMNYTSQEKGFDKCPHQNSDLGL